MQGVASSSAANLILDEVVEPHDQPAVIFPSSGIHSVSFVCISALKARLPLLPFLCLIIQPFRFGSFTP